MEKTQKSDGAMVQSRTQENSVESFIMTAIEKQLPVETMERLLAMRKELKAEQAKEAYDEAMATFQGECPVIEKDKPVGFETKSGSGRVGYSYAPLDHIIRQVKEIIAKHGFSYSFKIENSGQSVKAICVVKHKLGHSDSSEFTVDGGGTPSMSSAQVTSSKATYAKRNAFCNAFGITTGDEDNDAVKSKEEAKQENLATPEQHEEIQQLIKEAGVTQEAASQRCKEMYQVELKDITKTQAMGVILALKKKIRSAS